MAHNTSMGLPRPVLPTLQDIQRRRAELLGGQPDHQPEEQAPPLRATPPPRQTPAWPTLDGAALYGLAGLVVRAIAPHTEADPAAILLQLLAAFGNILGSGPHCMVESTRHSLNLFVVLVGESSKARKGTSWRYICRLFSEVDEDWVARRVTTARLTAGGLIHALRDQEPATDRRLLVLSEEFASVLHVLGREKGHLSPLLRCAWDSGNLRTLDRHSPLEATGTHISLVGHITHRELIQHLHRTESHNGFANRCLWTCVRRSKCLPEGGSLKPDELSGVARELRRILSWASSATETPLCRNQAARELWNDFYPALSHARPGAYGAATSRAEAQVLRLSAIYAALDCSSIIAPSHLQAALAVWEYCSASAAFLFGASTAEPAADRIHHALGEAPEGLTRKQIRGLFHGHLSSERIDAALEELTSLGLVTNRALPGQGRPSMLWSAIEDPDLVQE